MTITPSVPEHRNAKAEGRPGQISAQRRGLASALAGVGHDDPGTLAAIRRNCGLVSLERWLAGATWSGQVMEALLAATQDLVDATPAYAAFAGGEDDTIRVLRRGPNGTQSRVLDVAPHDLTAGTLGRDPSYWHRVLGVARQTLASPAEPGDDAWMILPLSTLEGTYGALGVALPEDRGLNPDEEAGLRAAVELSAEALQRLYLQRERDTLRRDLQETRAQLERLRERVVLSESLAAIGELVSSVAHELNNPLTSVIGFAQLLQTLDVQEDIKSDLAIIDSEARRCQRIVQNLLGLARQQELDLASVQVNEMVHRTLELKAYSLRIDNIETLVDLDPRIPPVRANPCKLQQALLNLVNNAHEAMLHARGSGTLLIRTEPATFDGRPMVRVSITDDGPGVPAAVRQRLFEPFFTTKRPENGTGLGLAITRQIAEECGGRLTLDDAYTSGAKFDLELPVDDAVLEPALTSWAAAGEPPAAPALRNAPARYAGVRVLLVDDETELVDLVTRVLAEDGHVVEHAPEGREALRRLANSDYDLVLLDMRMPGLSGQDVYRVIEQDYPGLAHRVILTTGDVVSSPTSDWLQATGCPVLEKPFDVAQLRTAVASALGEAEGSQIPG
jgi:signal transduction histidine kinase/ActR/RegA family two-component response regulator